MVPDAVNGFGGQRRFQGKGPLSQAHHWHSVAELGLKGIAHESAESQSIL
ncbi:hypothetical protein A1F94_006872 [Pyrenophora tritici-repentis]|uniref:Uncharacterized protein n=1 Tax=Pyrenophora tritici-repentis TaxID=45151 RepID=A0A5M9KSJ7_9PLEO|nr:hypothetical protein PtrV1_13056 [Pyrenophora tritici-repentis]KAF7569271.1 hypothetical protein PtrM4_116860 [Pyrenophora tritici-repentis]KAG9382951.1 hypothetical protein A1F94_006872 [Pyrenophora tritici-repentis]KAI1510932.1 hypothetical protein Ptr86124_010053 [Pyrenophora tritici-repentis]KAI1668327.1 hypothetical protein L13192_07463 [Pyrenophora tritici-repentis]